MTLTRLLLTFDVEELDWGQAREGSKEPDDGAASAQGVRALLPLLDRSGARATFFCTAHFAQCHEPLVREIHACRHEIGSHGLDHRDDYRRLEAETATERLAASRRLLEDVTGAAVPGVRTPRLAPCPADVIRAAGFRYDASPRPSWAASLAATRLLPRHPWQEGEIVRVPLSTVPFVRLTLSWYLFRVVGPRLTALLASLAAYGTPYVHLYFHPWEAADLSRLRRPHPLALGCGEAWLARFDALLGRLAGRADPVTISEMLVAVSGGVPGPA